MNLTMPTLFTTVVMVAWAPSYCHGAFWGAPNRISRLLIPIQASRSGIVYVPEDSFAKNAPVVKLFARTGCIYCDEVIETLRSVSNETPHTLELMDIDDSKHLSWWEKYKYDLPVLRINDIYWTFSRLTTKEAKAGIYAASAGFFVQGRDEPNAKQMELQMMQPPLIPKTNVTSGGGEIQDEPKPRRASSGNFQKLIVQGIRDRHTGTCDLKE